MTLLLRLLIKLIMFNFIKLLLTFSFFLYRPPRLRPRGRGPHPRGPRPVSPPGALPRLAALASAALLAILALPVVGLVLRTGPARLGAALTAPTTHEALGLSLGTTGLTLALTVLLGTPLAWRLSRHARPWHKPARIVLALPVVMPPAVLGVALLETFGRQGLLGPGLDALGVALPFSTAAVVLAQLVVASPLYVLTASAAFAAVDDDLLLVARTLGASPARAWRTVALPIALPGLASGAALAWARALGEFGATLMFAGSLPGRTQTLPLAIYEALERDLDLARALSVLMVAVALAVLLGLGAHRSDGGLHA